MAREKKIIDTSVIVKWFLEEQGSLQARRILEDHSHERILLLAPDFVVIELLNVLRYKHWSEDELLNAVQDFYAFQVQLQHTATVIPQACRLALEYDLSIYDALYAGLAELHNCSLLTADNDLAKTPYGDLLQSA